MKTKTKVVKFKASTWRKLRGLIRAKRGETFSAYLDRVVEYMETYQDIYGKNIQEAVKMNLKVERGREW